MADIKSQEISINLAPGTSSGSKYLSSITSLSVRIPAFDHVEHLGKAYMKIKSNEFLFARSQLVSAESSPKVGNAKQSQDKDERQNVIIVPTDDSRLKAIIIPRECLAY